MTCDRLLDLPSEHMKLTYYCFEKLENIFTDLQVHMHFHVIGVTPLALIRLLINNIREFKLVGMHRRENGWHFQML